MLNSATTGEIEQLTEEQKASFRHGLQSHLGEQGFDEFFDEMYRRELAASGVTPPSPGYRASVHGDGAFPPGGMFNFVFVLRRSMGICSLQES